MKFYWHKELKSTFQRHPSLSYFFIFGLAFFLFLFLQMAPTFPDPDSFYHAKMAVLLKEQGLVTDFPWTQFTVLKDFYIDHHLLYHILLLPFIWFLPPLFGVKLATIIFASIMITGFYWLLKKMAVRYASFYTILLLSTNAFIFRLNLAKAQALAILLLLIGIYFIFEKKYLALFVLSFVYVWLYGGWPLILFVAIVYSISEIPFLFTAKKAWPHTSWFQIFSFLKMFTPKKPRLATQLRVKFARDLKMFGAIIGGLCAGIIFNPYFPKNLYFYWQQIIEIAVVNYKNVIGVGGEWYSYSPFELVSHANFAFLFFIVGLTFFFLNIRFQSKRSVFFFLLSIIFLALTFKSRRNVEYLIPCIVAFSAIAIELFLRRVKFGEFYKELVLFIKKERIFALAIALPMIVFPYVIIRDARIMKDAYNSGFRFDHLQHSSEWLLKNSKKDEIVFTSDWDEFPFLFYFNSHNRYIVGLDPTFMYAYDPELHKKFENVTQAREGKKMHAIIKNDFLSSYVLVTLKRHENFDTLLKGNTFFLEVYRDEEASIYRVL